MANLKNELESLKSTRKSSFISHFSSWCLLLLIALTPFSFKPRYFITRFEGLNLELSPVQIVGILFIALSLPIVLINIRRIFRLQPIKILTAFVAINVLTLPLSLATSRSLVLLAYLVFLYLIVLGATATLIYKQISMRQLISAFVGGAVVSATFGIYQLIGEPVGISRDFTLIRDLFDADTFGFPRIHGFTLEPQFYVSTMIAPLFISLYYFLTEKRNSYVYGIFVLVFSIVSVLTLSRGGLLALGIATIVLALIGRKTVSKKRILKAAGIGVASVITAMLLVFISAEIHYKNNVSGLQAVKNYVEHGSLGTIKFKKELKKVNIDKNVDSTDIATSDKDSALVEESTTGRLNMANEALRISTSSITDAFVGVGIGGFGPRVARDNPENTRSDIIVNNQYLETMVEVGLLGLILFLAFWVSFIQTVWQKAVKYRVMLISITTAFLVQYLFFSSLANILHIWLFVGIALGFCEVQLRKA